MFLGKVNWTKNIIMHIGFILPNFRIGLHENNENIFLDQI